MKRNRVPSHEMSTRARRGPFHPQQKVLQILVNLVRNARQACDQSGQEDLLPVAREKLNAEN